MSLHDNLMMLFSTFSQKSCCLKTEHVNTLLLLHFLCYDDSSRNDSESKSKPMNASLFHHFNIQGPMTSNPKNTLL